MSRLLALLNGNIHTMDQAWPRAQALALADGHILAVGTDDEVRQIVGATAETIDLQGRAVIPAFTDAHVHLMSWALSLDRIDLYGVDSLDQALEIVAERARKTAADEWIRGRGWNHTLWDGVFPAKEDLDRVVPDRPVALGRADGHSLWCNSAALARAGIARETPDPAGGRIGRDPQSGEPTGMLFETAKDLVYDVIPEPTAAERQDALRRAFPIAYSHGIAGIHEMGYLGGGGALSDYQVLLGRRELGLRITLYLPQERLDEAIALGIRSGFGNAWLQIGGVKCFMDGSLGSNTADMLEDFEGLPGNRGIAVTTAEEIKDIVQRASQAGLACAVHAIGDAANRKVLDAVEAAQATAANGALPHRVEHAQLTHPADVPRFAQLGVVASMQPIHATSDMLVAEKYWGARCAYGYAWRSLLDSGAVLAFGSDCPVERIDVLPGIHAAVTRRRADGTPPDGWYPEQSLTVDEAVGAFTMGAARTSGEEAIKGSLTPGKVADIVVLSRDIFTCPADEILETRVVGTVLGGRVVFWED